jgi:hypothetical protein
LRTKKFEMDGASYTITPLTLAQTEAWKNAPAVDLEDKTIKARFLPHFRDVICPSLNNVLPKDANGDAWTPERCYQEMDQIVAMKLFSAILEFSGYKINTGDESPQGETQAPSTSPVSAGA